MHRTRKKTNPTEKRSRARFVVFLCGFQKGTVFLVKIQVQVTIQFSITRTKSDCLNHFWLCLTRRSNTSWSWTWKCYDHIHIVHFSYFGDPPSYSSAAHLTGLWRVTQPIPIWRVVGPGFFVYVQLLFRPLKHFHEWRAILKVSGNGGVFTSEKNFLFRGHTIKRV